MALSSSGIITSIQASQPATPGAPADWRTQLGQIVVEISTDAGFCGIGVGGGGSAGIHIIQTVLADMLVGREATDVEQLHAEMLAHTAFYGRKGVVIMAISGVDLALWDLRGKRLEQPIAELLSPGEWNRPLPTYATVFDEHDAQVAIEAGHEAIKLHVERFGSCPTGSEIGTVVGEARRRLGPDAMIMVDAFARWDLDTAQRVADAIAPHDIAWLEEPLPPDDLAGYERLARDCPIPIAGGEHEYTAAGFRELIDRRVHAVLQPDVNWCGGLTTLIDVYHQAAQAGLRVCPHRGCEPFALPAIAALDRTPLAESPRRWFRCLQGAPEIHGGWIQPSRTPGFGVDYRV